MPDLVTRATQTVGSLTGPVDTLAVAGRIVAFVVVAAAGLFLVTRRRVEFTFLHARGVGPLRIAGRRWPRRSCRRRSGPRSGGCSRSSWSSGWGPTDMVTYNAVRSAAKQVFWSTLAAVVVLGLVTSIAVRAESEARTGGRLRQVAARFPWELIVLALAAASYYEVVTRGTQPVENGSRTDRWTACCCCSRSCSSPGLAGSPFAPCGGSCRGCGRTDRRCRRRGTSRSGGCPR